MDGSVSARNAVTERVSESETGFGGQMKKPLAHRMTVPSARSPSPPGEAVAGVEDLRELDAAKTCDVEKRSRLHLDHDAALAPPPRHPRSRLAIDRIGGPGLTTDVVVVVLAQYRLDRRKRSPGGCDFARRR